MAMQKDVVCGMQVDEKKSSAKSEHQGRTYYFCSSECKRTFDQQPEQYANQQNQVGTKSQGTSNR